MKACKKVNRLFSFIRDATTGVDYFVGDDNDNTVDIGTKVNPKVLNGFFSLGWQDCIEVDSLANPNQNPTGWNLSWLSPGESLYSAPNDKAAAVPYCIHVCNSELPRIDTLTTNEHGPYIENNASFKIGHASLPFGAQLEQTIYVPQGSGVLSAHVMARWRETGIPNEYAMEAKLYANGVTRYEGWVRLDTKDGGFANGKWRLLQQPYSHNGGAFTIKLKFKSKWPMFAEFIIDSVQIKHTFDSED